MNALNLGLRFLLELAALGAMGIWGWTLSSGPLRFVGVWALPLAAAALWGIFAVPGDPSRSGKAPVPTSGVLRLALELVFFTGAAYLYYHLHYATFSVVFAALVVVHYLFSHKRIRWLLKQ